jgi:hypothetical protein
MSSLEGMQGLQAFRIAGLPPDFYYIPNFISVEEEKSILQKVGIVYLRHHTLPRPLCETLTPVLFLFLP